MLKCGRCKETKKKGCFNKDKTRTARDGLKYWCKECEKRQRGCSETKEKKREYSKAYREANKENLLEYIKEYRKNNTEQVKKVQKEYEVSPRGRAKQKEYRLKRKYKTRAVNAVNRAIAKGIIQHISTRLCEDCEQPAKEYHHPNGYNKEHWFDIVPLCKACHIKRH